MKEHPDLQKCQHTNFISAQLGLECENCGLLKLTIENNPSQYIDPVAQVFMDFYANLMEPNDDGETRMIDYAYWAKQVRMVLIVDCACHESWREGITHSKYECYGKDIRILRAELAEKARKETEEELFKFEPEN